MKVIIYSLSNTNPKQIANQVRSIVESQTGQQCIVKINGDQEIPTSLSVGN